MERLKKFFLLLGSDKPGEVVAAAHALVRTLNSDGRDLHDLVGALNGKRQEHIVYVEKRPSIEELSPREIAQIVIDEAMLDLKDHEFRFVQDMAARYSAPTEKQEAWLFGLYDKYIIRKGKR
jgi:hypothetical protein